jgi:hypothetical protein
MVCAMFRLFQSEEDDRIMEGDFDPEEEKLKRLEEEREAERQRRPGLIARLRKILPLAEG